MPSYAQRQRQEEMRWLRDWRPTLRLAGVGHPHSELLARTAGTHLDAVPAGPGWAHVRRRDPRLVRWAHLLESTRRGARRRLPCHRARKPMFRLALARP